MEPLLERVVLARGQWLHITRGRRLFLEGERPKGAYLLCSGKVQLTISEHGRLVYEREALPGEVLGLASAVNSRAHKLTATVLSDSIVGLVPCEVLQKSIADDVIFGMRCLELLTQELRLARSALRLGSCEKAENILRTG